jgi:hypothetical protein
MNYREIVAVTGIGGLFQLVATKSDGAIVKSLSDKTTRFIPARLHNVTPLESIEVYTTGENVRLHDVFQKMKENENVPLPDGKKADNKEIKGYFKGIFPEFDEERVYVSDMKKMLKWYEVLKQNDLLNFEKQEDEAAEEPAAGPAAAPGAGTETEDVKVEKKPRAKKSADEAAAEESEEKPKKTARKKKTTDEGDTAAEKPAKKTARKKKEEG